LFLLGEPPVEQRRHLRLMDAHQNRRRNLGQKQTLDRLADMTRKVILGQLFLGLRRQVGEDIAAALGHRNSGFLLLGHCA